MSFFKSKINWVGIITVLIGTLTSMQSLNLSPETMGYIMMATGILTTVLRTFFSSPLTQSDK
jgi:flagellar motor component MotA